MAVTLGKDVSVTGVSNARSVTVDASGNEIDITKLGDTVRKFRTSHVELTCEVECVDDPGVSVGGTFTLSGPQIVGGTFTLSGPQIGASKTFVVTSVVENQPLDDIITYTVSASNTESA